MSSRPPTNHLSYLARKCICGPIDSSDYITALKNAEVVLCWKECQEDPGFQAQIVMIISFCRPLAEKQDQELKHTEEQKRLELKQAIARHEETEARRKILKEQTISTFGSLAEKYGASRESVVDDCDEPSYLVKILVELEEGKPLSEVHCKWLIDHRLFLVLAACEYKDFQKSGDPWSLAKAGKYFRKASKPSSIIELVTDQVLSKIVNSKARSALLTNRGGAKRDLNDIEGAKSDGHEAINIDAHSFYPHNLLGAVYYQAGQPALGDKHFEHAVELGASPKEQEYEISSALKRSTPEARETVINYLLAKNPVKYAWVSSFHRG